MKQLLLTALGVMLFAALGFGQVSEQFKYQAVVRDNGGSPMMNTTVGLRINIWEGGPTGTKVYSETHAPTTNEFGLVNLMLGGGTPEMGTWGAIDWASDAHWVEVELDAAGGTSYVSMGASELLSVPYAIHAKTADGVDLSADTVWVNVLVADALWADSSWTEWAWAQEAVLDSAWIGYAWTDWEWTGIEATDSSWTDWQWTGAAQVDSAWTDYAWNTWVWNDTVWTNWQRSEWQWTGLAHMDSSWTEYAWTDWEWTGIEATDSSWTDWQWTAEAYMDSAWTDYAWNTWSWNDTVWTNWQRSEWQWTGLAHIDSSWTEYAWTDWEWTGVEATDSSWTDWQWTGEAYMDSSWTDYAWTDSSWTSFQWTESAWTDSAWTSFQMTETTVKAWEDEVVPASTVELDAASTGIIFVAANAGAANISGLANGVPGQTITIVNKSANNVTLNHSDISSAQPFLLESGTPIVLPEFGSVSAVCDGANWFVVK